jgi:hypothetical protein
VTLDPAHVIGPLAYLRGLCNDAAESISGKVTGVCRLIV